MLPNIGATELIIIAIVLFVLFGGKKLSKIAGEMGEATREFGKVKKEAEKTVSGKFDDEEEKEKEEEKEEQKEEKEIKNVKGKNKGGGS